MGSAIIGDVLLVLRCCGHVICDSVSYEHRLESCKITRAYQWLSVFGWPLSLNNVGEGHLVIFLAAEGNNTQAGSQNLTGLILFRSCIQDGSAKGMHY